MTVKNVKLVATVQASVACADNDHKRTRPMRAHLCLAAMLVLLPLALMPVAFARAQQTGGAYAVDYDRLYRLDIATREASLIGAAGNNGPQFLGDLSGLTTTADGRLYAASDSAKALLQLDQDTGAATVVGLFGIVAAGDPTAPLDYAMTAACDGSLWLTSAATAQLWRVDPNTAQTTLIGNTGYTITGLAVHEHALYGTGGRGDEGLYQINTSSGAATRIGNGYGRQVDYAASVSPAFNAADELLAIVNYVPPEPGSQAPVATWSDLATIDPQTGIASVLGSVTGPASLAGIGIRGFTLGPPQCASTGTGAASTAIPSSSRLTLALQLLGICILATLAMRRRDAVMRKR